MTGDVDGEHWVRVWTLVPRSLDKDQLHALHECLDRLPAHAILALDFSQVAIVSSVGLHGLLSLLRQARPHHVNLHVIGLSPAVRAIFELTHVDRLFHLHVSMDSWQAWRQGRHLIDMPSDTMPLGPGMAGRGDS